MDGQEYLNQISAQARPKKAPRSGGFVGSPIFKVIIGGVAALFLIIIMGSVLGGGAMGLKDKAISLKLYMGSTMEVISGYQNNVKSSNLRSSSTSLYSVLSNTDRELTNYLTEKYAFTDKSVDSKMAEQEALRKDGLTADLFEAKINGILDRIYAHKMAYEISMIMSKESSVYDSTNDATLKDLLQTSYSSLENLYKNFDEFSETK